MKNKIFTCYKARVVLILLAILAANGCKNVRQNDLFSSDYIVEEINIDDGVFNNRVFIPVTIESDVYTFLLDTGASSTVIHSSLGIKKENILGQELVGSVVDPVYSKTYMLSSAYIGSLEMQEAPVYLMDFNTAVVAKEGRGEYQGIVGVNSFKGYVLYLDVKLKKLYILNALPFAKSKLGTEFDIFFDQYGLPTVNLNVFDDNVEDMLIDTGAVLSSLDTEAFDRLAMSNDARVVDTLIEGASGAYSTKLTWVDTVKLAGQEHTDVAIFRSSTSLLGMDILSEYIVVLDFINNKLYLKPQN